MAAAGPGFGSGCAGLQLCWSISIFHCVSPRQGRTPGWAPAFLLSVGTNVLFPFLPLHFHKQYAQSSEPFSLQIKAEGWVNLLHTNYFCEVTELSIKEYCWGWALGTVWFVLWTAQKRSVHGRTRHLLGSFVPRVNRRIILFFYQLWVPRFTA